MTATRYSVPWSVDSSVESACHSLFGWGGLNWRWHRSGAGVARGPRRVSPGRQRRRRWRPTSPAERISRATRLRPTLTPQAICSSAWIRGAP
jgi:hypothetical protein